MYETGVACSHSDRQTNRQTRDVERMGEEGQTHFQAGSDAADQTGFLAACHFGENASFRERSSTQRQPC